MLENKLVCVLFNAGKGDELTEDCLLRIKAGLKIPDAELCFVGEKTWLMRMVEPNKKVTELNNCRDTIGNIREIVEYTKNHKFSEIIIISNHYHLQRISLIADIFKLKAKLKAAEDILEIKRKVSLMAPLIYLATFITYKLKLIP